MIKKILFTLSAILFFISLVAPVFNLCGLAHAELSFTDITESAGTGGPTGTDELGGHGVMFCDVDVDGRPDLYITMNWNTGVIYRELFFRNNGGNVFSGEAAEWGIDDPDGGSHGACWADLDNDGDYDLFNGTTLKSSGDPDGNDVFRNDGDRYFTDVTPASITGRQEYTRGVLTFDMDADGDLDLFGVSGYQGTGDGQDDRNEVYRNEGDFSFTPITSGALYTCPAGQGAVDTDFDGDGDIDVIAANRTGPVNILLNDGSGSFTLVSPSSIGITQGAGDGITTADVDNDGDLDMLLAGNDIGHLYLNNGSGTFSFKRDFSSTDGFMGGFADLDNDGDMDLVFAGDNLVYLNDGNGNFSAGPAVPVSGINDPRAIAFADIDDDGDMDFAIGVKRSRNWLVRNNFNTGMWLKVKLVSPQGQAGAFGAKVRIYPAWEAGGVLLGMRESRSNSGYLGQDDPVLHFGLGSHESVDVEVEFLDGVIVTRTDVAANQTITINGGLPSGIVFGLAPGGQGYMEVVDALPPYAHLDWVHVPWPAYNTAAGGTHPCLCNLDDDPYPELVVGLDSYPAKGGYVEIRDDYTTGYAHLSWLRVPWPAYNAVNGATYPTCGDFDGDGRNELAIGLGMYTTTGGYVEIRGDYTTGYAHQTWVRVPWPAYNAANGATYPTAGDFDGDGRDELTIGLGTYQAKGGYVEIRGDATTGFTHIGWVRVPWPAYNADNGATYPTLGDFDGDGRDELAIGLGTYPSRGGYIEIRGDATTGFPHIDWVRVPWPAYNADNGATYPTLGDFDGDGRDELAIGLGTYMAKGGYVEIRDDSVMGFAHRGWPRVHWPAYNSANGETRPGLGR